jgi:glyoxylase-like metal-dependent hydrolase (beta-lactamase superfamily II)
MEPRFNKRLMRPVSASIERRLRLKPLKTGRVPEGVWAVRTDTVNFFIAETGAGLVCFDTGYRRALILEELRKLDLNRLDVASVFLTHADIDHTRGLRLFPNAEVYLSRDEKQMVTGLRNIRSAVRSPRLRRPCYLLRDGDVVRAGDTLIRAIETPGHTPGSMAYLLDEQYLFTGDTCKLAGGKAYAGSHYTMDYKRQTESIRKIAMLENVRYVFTAHAGYTDDFEGAFGDWRK